MLAAGAAEAVEGVPCDVIAALYGNFLDRVRHVFDRDLEESVGDLFGLAVADLLREIGERIAHCIRIEREILCRTENLREEFRNELANHHVGVGDGQRSIASVAFGPGFAAAESGPTRKRAPSKCSIEPPPAATVWMSIIGARMRTPATSVSNARSYSPSKWDTSVDVPPMSK